MQIRNASAKTKKTPINLLKEEPSKHPTQGKSNRRNRTGHNEDLIKLRPTRTGGKTKQDKGGWPSKVKHNMKQRK